MAHYVQYFNISFFLSYLEEYLIQETDEALKSIFIVALHRPLIVVH